MEQGGLPVLSTVIALGSLTGLIVSLLLLARQTQVVARQKAEVAKQTEIANAIAGAEVSYHILSCLREVLLQLVDRPELRAYLYDGKRCPRRGRKRQQVLSLIEILADTLNTGMRAHRWAPGTTGLPNWPLYSWHMLGRSPTLRTLVHGWPAYWSDLHELIEFDTEGAVHRYVAEHRNTSTVRTPPPIPLPEMTAVSDLLSPLDLMPAPRRYRARPERLIRYVRRRRGRS